MKRIVKKGEVYWPSEEFKRELYPNSEDVYKEAEKNPTEFWEDLARTGVTWYNKWHTPYVQKLPRLQWFVGGKLNACYNALDRHIQNGREERTAIIWVPEPLKERPVRITYRELYSRVNKAANALKRLGIKKGDVVGIYLPLIPEAAVAMLACARIGAIHSIVFSAFSAEALKTRLIDGRAKLLITADGYYRKGKEQDLYAKAADALKGTPVKKVLVVNRLGKRIQGAKVYSWAAEMRKSQPYCEPEVMDSNDPLFILYTSGTTGTPKGVIHDTGGYVTQAYWTTKWNFALKENGVMWCTADIGWVTGHTYMVYGPLFNGVTTLMYEGLINYPTPARIWDIIDRNNVNSLYTAPTAIRVFMSEGDKWLKGKKLDSLRVIGSVGEPIDVKTWLWYFKNIGKEQCPVIDTYWQTETGGNIINALPGVGPFKPSYAGRSFPGTRHLVLNEKGKPARKGQEGYLVEVPPVFPGMMVGVWRNPKRFMKYWKNKRYYITGDRAFETKDGFRILGRADDVLNVAGHRVSTAEIENALYKHPNVAECAIASQADKIRGEVPVAFIKLKKHVDDEDHLKKELLAKVVHFLGPTSKPHAIYVVSDLPKTRSGKIMRRIMKSLLNDLPIRGVSTLVNPKSVNELKKILRKR